MIAVDVGHGQRCRRSPPTRACSRARGQCPVADARRLPPPIRHHCGRCLVYFADTDFAGPCAAADGQRQLVCLVKPQFEVGAAHLGKGGIVRDPKARAEAVARVAAAAHALGLRETARMVSPIEGSDGNIEFLLALENSMTTDTVLTKTTPN